MKFFHPIVWDFVFRSQVKLGAITSVGGKPIPVNELFIQGGLFSLRGYDNLVIGPKAQLTNALSTTARNAGLKPGDEIVLGGQYEVLTNLEVEFPLLKEARIRGVVFFDAGNSFNGFFDGQSPALFANYGFGLRWFTPIGPLRFEFGYPIVTRNDPKLSGSKFYFTIGPPF